MNEEEQSKLAQDSTYLIKILENVIECHKCNPTVVFLTLASMFCRACVSSGFRRSDALKIVRSAYELGGSLKNEQDDEK